MKKEVNSEKRTVNEEEEEGGREKKEDGSYEAGEIDSEDIGGDDSGLVMTP